MNNQESKIVELIWESLEGADQQFVENNKGSGLSDVVLFGKGAELESLSLVSFIVDLESELSMQFDKEISLTDDRAMTREVSPYANIQTMKDYILELINE